MSKAIDLENGLPAIKTWVESKIPSPADTAPVADGTAAVGTSADYAREDHRHPTDTSRAPNNHASTATTYGAGTSSNYGHVKLSDATNGTAAAASGGTAATPKAVADALAAATGAIPAATTTTPKMDGTAAVGSETKWAKGDHVHPTDTSRAPTSHASSATTYGAGTGSNYGHVKLSDATNGTAAAASGGTAATPKAVNDALNAAKSYADSAVEDGKNVWYGESTTEGSTAVKAVTTDTGDFSYDVGNILVVRFLEADSVSGTNTSLNVDGLGSKLIYYRNAGAPNQDALQNTWMAGEVVIFAYDGDGFTAIGKVPASSARYGVVKLSDATDGTQAAAGGHTAATPAAVKAVKDAIPAASTTNPSMDGTASYGSGTAYARSNHVHPTDTSRAPTSHASSATTYGTGTSSNYGHLKLSDSTSSTSGTSGGTAATPKAVADALTAAKSYADGKVTGLYNYKGSVATYAALPASPATGDVYNVEAAYGDYPAGANWAWTGSAWDALGGSFTITFATAAEVTAVLNGTT